MSLEILEDDRESTQEDKENSEQKLSQSSSEKKSNDKLADGKDIDTLELAEELKIPDNDDIISEISAKISNLKNPAKKISVVE